MAGQHLDHGLIEVSIREYVFILFKACCFMFFKWHGEKSFQKVQSSVLHNEWQLCWVIKTLPFAKFQVLKANARSKQVQIFYAVYIKVVQKQIINNYLFHHLIMPEYFDNIKHQLIEWSLKDAEFHLFFVKIQHAIFSTFFDAVHVFSNTDRSGSIITINTHTYV